MPGLLARALFLRAARLVLGALGLLATLVLVVGGVGELGRLRLLDAGAADLGALLAGALPAALGWTAPLASYLGVALLVRRLRRDRELEALFAAGISPRRLALPVLALAGLVSLGAFALQGFWAPTARFAARGRLARLARRSHARLELAEGRPGRWRIGRDLLAIEVPGPPVAPGERRRLEGLSWIRIRRDGQAVEQALVARRGWLQGSVLQLEQGWVLRAGAAGARAPWARFGSYVLDLEALLPRPPDLLVEAGATDRDLRALRALTAIRPGREAQQAFALELHFRLAMALLPLALAPLALRVGIHASRPGAGPGAAGLHLLGLLPYALLPVGRAWLQGAPGWPAAGLLLVPAGLLVLALGPGEGGPGA